MCFRRLDSVVVGVLSQLEFEGGGALMQSLNPAPGPDPAGRHRVMRFSGMGKEADTGASASLRGGNNENGQAALKVGGVVPESAGATTVREPSPGRTGPVLRVIDGRENITVLARRPSREPVPGSAVVFSMPLVRRESHARSRSLLVAPRPVLRY